MQQSATVPPYHFPLDIPARRGVERLTVNEERTAVVTREPVPLEAYRLRLQGLSFGEISKLTGHAKSSIHQALTHLEAFLPSQPQQQAFEQARPSLLTASEEVLLASLTDPATIEKASLRDRAVSFGIVYDKRRLEQGQSTSNLAVWAKCVESAHKDLYTQAKQSDKGNACLDVAQDTTDKTTT